MNGELPGGADGLFIRGQHRGQAEVCNLYRPFRRDDHILRTQVAVDDPLGVRMLQRLADSDTEVHRDGVGEWSDPADSFLQINASDEFRNQEWRSLFLADVVDA